MNKQQSGFTLIELIAVIVILGILAATALPRFIDMSAAAEAAALDAIEGNMSSAMALNYAGTLALAAGGPNSVTPAPQPVDDCDDIASLLVGGQLPAGYTVAAAPIVGGPGTAVNCAVTQTASGAVGAFQGIATL